MARSLVRKITYFVGGAVAVVALIGAAGLAYIFWPEWVQAQRGRASEREESRTHDRPLNPADIIEADATKTLAPVRTPHVGSDDVLNFVSMPSFHTWRAVSISLSPRAAMAEGRIVSVNQHGDLSKHTFTGLRSFSAPRAAFLRTAGELDGITDGWAGSVDCYRMYDGTPVAFERIRSGRVTSGWGSVECDKHYAAVREIVFSFLRRYAPDPDLAKSASEATWRP